MNLVTVSARTDVFEGDNPLSVDRHAGTPMVRLLGTLAATAALTCTATVALPSRPDSLRGIAERLGATRSHYDRDDPLLPFMVVVPRGQDAPVAGLPVLAAERTAARALLAVDELVRVTGLSEEALADLAGFSRRSISNWRRGSGAYPRTVRGLFAIRAIVRSTASSIGEGDMRDWLLQPRPDGQRMNLLSTHEGRERLSDEIAAELFAVVRQPQGLAPDDEQWLDPPPAAATPRQFSDAPLRARHVE